MKLFKQCAIVALVLGGTLYAQQPINDSQVGGTAVLTGNGTTGAGSQRVTIASDNTAFAVNATLSAETTKVIGVIRASDGAGNLLTSNSTTYTAKFGLDSNLLGTLGTAFTTAGFVDVKGADGNVFVRQTTGTNLHAVLDTTSTTAVTQATAANLNATVVQATGSNLHVVCDSGCTTGTTISLIPATSGGLSHTHFVAAASDNATSLKGSAGQLYTVDIYNAAAYPVYLKLYNKATSPTSCGATVLFKVVGVQAGTQKTLSSEQGYAMGTGIGYCLVKGITDADDTSVLISDATVDIGYK
jgi:hypothetical protein